MEIETPTVCTAPPVINLIKMALTYRPEVLPKSRGGGIIKHDKWQKEAFHLIF